MTCKGSGGPQDCRRLGAGYAARVFALVCVALSLALSRTAAAADLKQVQASGVLRWGGDLQGGEPYVFEDESQGGKVVGFEVDIAEALAAELGLRPKFVQTDWSNLVPSLERDDFDIIQNGLEDTEERRARILLSIPYFRYGETLSVRQGDAFRTLADLRGRRVGTLNQTVAHDLLKAAPVEVVLYEGQQEPYLDLINRRTDAVLLDHIIANRYGCPHKELACVPNDIARGNYVVGIARNAHELKVAVDRALAALIRSGKLQTILTKWQLWDARQETLHSELRALLESAGNAAPDARAAKVRAAAPDHRGRALSVSQFRLFVEGAAMTLAISLAAFSLAFPLGLLLALLRAFGGKFAKWFAVGYIELFRGTPALLQLYVLYYGISSYVKLSPFVAAVLGLGLNYAAYEAEVQRGALLAIPKGQLEAASSLGLTRLQTIRHVLLPQSMRSALPAVTNDFVALLKDSSLVSVITVVELTKRMTIVAASLREWLVPGLLCAGLYLAMSVPLSRLSIWLERRLAQA